MTAVADGLAGFAAAGLGNPGALPWLLASTACLYAGGVALNDFFDRELDLIERKEIVISDSASRPSFEQLDNQANELLRLSNLHNDPLIS